MSGNIPHTITHQQKPEPPIQNRMDPCFHAVSSSDSTIQTAQITTNQTRRYFSVQTVATVSPSVLFCCCYYTPYSMASYAFRITLLHTLVDLLLPESCRSVHIFFQQIKFSEILRPVHLKLSLTLSRLTLSTVRRYDKKKKNSTNIKIKSKNNRPSEKAAMCA